MPAPSNPALLAQFGPHRLAHRPYCSNDLHRHGVYRLSPEKALTHTHIQANSKALRWRIVFDIDRPGALFAAEDANVAPPNWIAVNPRNGHAHAGYELEKPVVMSAAGAGHPQRYAAAVHHAYAVALGADTAYSGLICKNPLHERWDTHIHNPTPYDLGELSEWVDLPQWVPSRDSHDIEGGRNVALFERLRKWAYRAVKNVSTFEAWGMSCQLQAHALNDSAIPLPANEVEDTARSVAQWTWDKFGTIESAQRFAKRQSERGKASGKARLAASEDKRSSARLMAASGKSTREIAEELGVGKSTIARWLT